MVAAPTSILIHCANDSDGYHDVLDGDEDIKYVSACTRCRSVQGFLAKTRLYVLAFKSIDAGAAKGHDVHEHGRACKAKETAQNESIGAARSFQLLFTDVLSDVVYSQPADTGTGQDINTQIVYAVDHLKVRYEAQ